MIRRAKKFISEVRTELSKATWPWDPKEKGFKKYRELIDSTGVVLVAMIMLGAFVALGDFFLINAVSAFTRTGIEERVRQPVANLPKPGDEPEAPAQGSPMPVTSEPPQAQPTPLTENGSSSPASSEAADPPTPSTQP